MITQKDIHNILIKTDDAFKAQVIKQCDCNIEKIKQFEKLLTDTVNAFTETIGKVWKYMNEEF